MKTLTATTSSSTTLTIQAVSNIGTASEKTWNLQKPANLIGSGRHCEIALPHDDVADSHAVIVNTGREAILVDLLSDGGTFCNGRRVNSQVLEAGDVVRVGGTEITLEISKPRHPAPAGKGELELAQPDKMPIPVLLSRVDRREHWEIEGSVAIIGSHGQANVRVQEDDVAPTHSIVFATRQGIAIYDLGSSNPLKINGREARFGYLRHQDRILVGGIGLTVHFPTEESISSPLGHHRAVDKTSEMSKRKKPKQAGQERLLASTPDSPATTMGALPASASPEPRDSSSMNMEMPVEAQAESVMGTLEQKISALQQEIAQSWGQLNEWKKSLIVEQNQANVRSQDMDNKEKLLGQMADELDIRVHELAQKESQLKETEALLASQQTEIGKHKEDAEHEIEKTLQELRQREADIETRCTELSGLAGELDRRESEVQNFAEQYESQRKELETIKESIAADSKAVEKDRQALDEFQVELEAQTEELADRQAELKKTENQLREQSAMGEAKLEETENELRQQWADRQAQLEKTENELRQQLADHQAQLEKTENELRQQWADRQAQLENTETELGQELEALRSAQKDLDDRDQSLAQRRDQLAEYETTLQTKWEELTQRAKQIEHRSVIIERFGQFLEEANEAYQITTDSQVELTDVDIPKVPELVAGETVAAAADIIHRTNRQIHSVVDGLEAQTRQMLQDLSESEPEEASPERESNIAEEDPHQAGQEDSTTTQQAPPEEEIDLSTLEPEVRKKFRLLKRLGTNGKSDTELLEQILAEVQQAKTEPTKRKGWWSR